MNAGELDTQITIQHKTVAYDTYNQPQESWVDLIVLWAAVITTGGREFYAAQKLNAETTAVFKLRYISGIKPTMRIKYGNKIYQILPPINDVENKHIELQIAAKEVV